MLCDIHCQRRNLLRSKLKSLVQINSDHHLREMGKSSLSTSGSKKVKHVSKQHLHQDMSKKNSQKEHQQKQQQQQQEVKAENEDDKQLWIEREGLLQRRGILCDAQCQELERLRNKLMMMRIQNSAQRDFY